MMEIMRTSMLGRSASTRLKVVAYNRDCMYIHVGPGGISYTNGMPHGSTHNLYCMILPLVKLIHTGRAWM